MSTSLLVFVPVALLFIVSGLCFVGCILDTSGTGVGTKPPDEKPKPFTTYSDNDVLADPSIVAAYWPLDEESPADGSMKLTAHDALGANDGLYKHKGNAPDLFPCPAFSVGPGADSAAEIGFLSLGVEAIVLGDAEQPPADPPVLKTGMQVRGAFVTVPYSPTINPGVFTVEAWVRPEWDAAVPAFRTVVDSRDNVGGTIHGFVLWASQAGNWEAAMADVDGNFLFATAGQAVLGETAYLAFTFDGVNAALFVNGVKASQPMSLPAAYSPNTTQDLVIGAGEPWLPDRMNSTGDNFFPVFPFNGVIQDVAIYNTVLDDSVIKTHFDDGSGKGPPTPPG
jgi:concanavalin A-like lectin/glucanase superfamily protein